MGAVIPGSHEPPTSVDYIIRHAAPTLAGLKTGNLFPLAFQDKAGFLKTLQEANQVLVPRGLRLLPMRLEEDKALLYLFRTSSLSRDLAQEQAREILCRAGYGEPGCLPCLRELTRRLRNGDEFPHEIGLFLGYPPEDVQGFIRHRGRDAKACGCWKVYGDKDAVQARFDAFKSCTTRYCRLREQGATLEHLTVES